MQRPTPVTDGRSGSRRKAPPMSCMSRCEPKATTPTTRQSPHGLNRTPTRPAWKSSDPRRQVSWLTARAVRPTFPTGEPGQWHCGRTSPFTVAGAAAACIRADANSVHPAPRSLFTRAHRGTRGNRHVHPRNQTREVSSIRGGPIFPMRGLSVTVGQTAYAHLFDRVGHNTVEQRHDFGQRLT
jgi:hypothetical protein